MSGRSTYLVLVDRDKLRVNVCQSVDRSLATVDWTVDRAMLVHVVHTGRPGGRSSSVLAYCKMRSRTFWLPISVLFLPMSLKNSSDVFYLLSLPTILHLSEDFSKSELNSNEHLAKSTHDLGEIDTRSRRNRHTISTWPTDETGPSKRIASNIQLIFTDHTRSNLGRKHSPNSNINCNIPTSAQLSNGMQHTCLSNTPPKRNTL